MAGTGSCGVKGSVTVAASKLHTSSLLCKLLSPLLTTHGMDRRTGKALPLTQLLGREAFDCSSLADRAFQVRPELLRCPGYGIDRTGSTDYLCATLDKVQQANSGDSRLVPLHVDGDGHCLVHAISRALVGRELFWHALRTALRAHLAEERDTYRALLADFLVDDEWDEIVRESEPDYRPLRGTLHGLRNVHLLGLSSVLRRPIILLDSDGGMASSGDYAGTFLPGLVPSEQRRRPSDGKLHRPLCVAWANLEHIHFVPLVGVRGLVPPVLPKEMLPTVWGFTDKALEDYIDFSEGDCCVIGGDRMLTDSYVERLISSMQEMFTEVHGIPPSFVVDCQESLNMGSWKTDGEMITTLKVYLSKGQLYRCIDCTGVFVVGNETTDGDRAAGVQDEEQQPCAVGAGAPSGARAPSPCRSCCSERVRMIREDGSTQYENTDRTSTPSGTCKCGFKHYWDGQEYDGLPQLLGVSFSLHGKRIEDTVVVFKDQSDPGLNTNAQKMAQYLQLKHFPGAEVSGELETLATLILYKQQQLLATERGDRSVDAGDRETRADDAAENAKPNGAPLSKDRAEGTDALGSAEEPAGKEQARQPGWQSTSQGGTVSNAAAAAADAAAAASGSQCLVQNQAPNAAPHAARNSSPASEHVGVKRGSARTDEPQGVVVRLQADCMQELILLNTMANVLGDSLWSFVKKLPYTFCDNGVFCRKASDDLELADGVHCSFPCLPGRVFVYNESRQRLDICLLERGHRPVGPELDDREGPGSPEALAGSLRSADLRAAGRGGETRARSEPCFHDVLRQEAKV
ncbi:deubiquitinating protein VCPIP1-like [Petromyzon marinus]|uniref:deubiquitinating protein VCPIP1-like n=1 Tax=Petromyzon marinus TaxID=7757 RepID=UPI003F6E5A6F